MSPGELMHFQGAPLAHVVLYYDVLREARVLRMFRDFQRHNRSGRGKLQYL